MRNFYRVSAGGHWTVVNAASISAGTAAGLRILAMDNGLKYEEKKGRLMIDVRVVKRNVHHTEQPKLDDYLADLLPR